MNRFEFLYRLQQGLSPLRAEDRAERCAFYEELISDMVEDGYTEEEAVARLGDPAALAEAILREEPEASHTDTQSPFRSWRDALTSLLQSGIGTVQRGVRHTQRYTQSVGADGIHSLEVLWGSGDAEIISEERDDIVLTEDRAEDDSPLCAEIADGTLRITLAEPGRISRGQKDLRVILPTGLAQVLNSCSVVTGSGDVILRDLRSEVVRVKTKSGDVTFRGIRAVEAEAVTVSGDMRLDADADRWTVASTSGDLELLGTAAEFLSVRTVSGDGDIRVNAQELTIQAVSGDMYFNGDAGHIRVNTVSGDAELWLSALPETMCGSTTSGDMEITLPRGSQCRVSFRTKSGELSCSRALDSGMGPLLELSTISGDVTVTA